MSAAEALRVARENGVRLGVAGADLILDADREPAAPGAEGYTASQGSHRRPAHIGEERLDSG